jgi:2',3'-cyclic-nucleotide 2'-phosphodiesterase (5'-nucleotidase family)
VSNRSDAIEEVVGQKIREAKYALNIADRLIDDESTPLGKLLADAYRLMLSVEAEWLRRSRP